MVFIETPIFTKQVRELLSDDGYAALQQVLLLRPETGVVMPRSGGLRKLRWRTSTGGKRGGIRLIYYWDTPHETIYMLLVYKKSQQADLTPDQLRVVRRLIAGYLQ